MVSANREMAVYCFDTLIAHYNSEQVHPPAFDEGEHPLFVTWNKVVNGGEPRLRGCIGTLEARALINGFRDYALTSALRDRRFPPIQAKELPQLQCTVSILTEYETAVDYLDWEGRQQDEPRSVFWQLTRSCWLEAENEVLFKLIGWTKVEAIDSLMRKSGYNGGITESLRKLIRLTRYQSTAFTLHYGEYIAYVKNSRGTVPTINGVKP